MLATLPDDVLERLYTIRDGLAAGCTVDELMCDVEVLVSLVELPEG